MNDLLSIGDFAGLCNTTKDTLIHYDNIGLLSPIQKSAKNRRLYHPAQCHDFLTILSLIDSGFTLHEIKVLLKSTSPSDVVKAFEHQKQILMQRFMKLQNTIDAMNRFQLLSAGLFMHFPGELFIYEQRQPQSFFATKSPDSPATRKEFFSLLQKHMKSCHENDISPFPLGFISKQKSPRASARKPFFVASLQPSLQTDNRTPVLFAGHYLAILHKGSFDSVYDSISLLELYMKKNSLHPLSDFYITIIHHPVLNQTNDTYFIKVLLNSFS